MNLKSIPHIALLCICISVNVFCAVESPAIREFLRQEEALLRARMMLKPTKLINKTIDEANLELFLRILANLKDHPALFETMPQEQKDAYLQKIETLRKTTKLALEQPISRKEYAHVVAYALAAAASIAGPVLAWRHALSSHGTEPINEAITFFELLSPVPATFILIYSAYQALNTAGRWDLKGRHQRVQDMFSLLKTTVC